MSTKNVEQIEVVLSCTDLLDIHSAQSIPMMLKARGFPLTGTFAPQMKSGWEYTRDENFETYEVRFIATKKESA